MYVNVRSCRSSRTSTREPSLQQSPKRIVRDVDAAEVDRWFADYLSAFAACGRGETEAAGLLAFYGVPLLVSTDDGFVALTTGDEVTAMAQRQVDGMRAAEYHHSAVLDFEVSSLNTVTALCRGTFSRRHRDGIEIGRLTATYLVTRTLGNLRISALTVHSS